MRHVIAAAVVLGLIGTIAGAQEKGKPPKEINAKGWINSEGISLEKLKGKVEDKEIADLIKAFNDAQVATKEAKAPAKATVKLTIGLGAEGRELSFDAAKGYGAFAKAVKAVEDLFAKYSK